MAEGKWVIVCFPSLEVPEELFKKSREFLCFLKTSCLRRNYGQRNRRTPVNYILWLHWQPPLKYGDHLFHSFSPVLISDMAWTHDSLLLVLVTQSGCAAVISRLGDPLLIAFGGADSYLHPSGGYLLPLITWGNIRCVKMYIVHMYSIERIKIRSFFLFLKLLKVVNLFKSSSFQNYHFHKFYRLDVPFGRVVIPLYKNAKDLKEGEVTRYLHVYSLISCCRS